MRWMFHGSAVFLILSVLLSCGGGTTAEEKLVGRWLYIGEDMVEYFADGTVQAFGQDLKRWEIEEGNPAILSIYHIHDGSLDTELEVTFEGDDRVILYHEEFDMTLELEREKE